MRLNYFYMGKIAKVKYKTKGKIAQQLCNFLAYITNTITNFVVAYM